MNPRNGSMRIGHPDVDVWDLAETCVLDVADRGETILEDIGAMLNLTRERVRQIEVVGLVGLKALSDSGLEEYLDD